MNKQIRLHALQNQIKRLQQRLESLNRLSYRYGTLRLIAFFIGMAIIAAVGYFIGLTWLFGISAIVFLVPFIFLIYYHRQLDQMIVRYKAWLRIKSTQIARMQLDWANIPSASHHKARQEHPFESDLTIVGKRSLHKLIDRAVSHEGSQRLKDWLTNPIPNREDIRQRQRLVRELVPLSLFRDKLILNGTLMGGTDRIRNISQLLKWLKQQSRDTSIRTWLYLLGALCGLNIVLLVLNYLGLIGGIWQGTFLIYLGLLITKSNFIADIFHEALTLQKTLQQLIAVFRHLETRSYRNQPHLKELCRPFWEHNRPSDKLHIVGWIVAATGVRGNPLIWFLLNMVFPWDIYFAYRLNQYKVNLAQYLPKWLDVWFEIEALSSLANLAYINPNYTFPLFLANDDTKSDIFQTQHLGHPLIPDDECVCNDFSLSELGQVVIITGSNMSGKSTFLRTVGINVALAYAGGPVHAKLLQTKLFRLFSCIEVSDSLTDGISYFYAEVKRLKKLLSELESEHSLPLLFFIDEIFRGTNNRERLIGSQAYVHNLVGKNGSGLISTHDLELVKLEDIINQVDNYHFRDDFIDGRMIFDYTLYSGPCPTTNALRIMEMAGLPIAFKKKM
ncbi:MAG: hypothetical protein B6242_03090 [Anaerolineaceae bacterium 4572_78]|nr:MAG: hypothetical protein B6242_03090 [Anaerolineaceae bacterium 4572_78]